MFQLMNLKNKNKKSIFQFKSKYHIQNLPPSNSLLFTTIKVKRKTDTNRSIQIHKVFKIRETINIPFKFTKSNAIQLPSLSQSS
jgi:hypothetical protein